jgi:hypothetical protein
LGGFLGFILVSNFCGGKKIQTIVLNGNEATYYTYSTIQSQFYQPCPLLSGAPPIGDTNLTHVMKLAAHNNNLDSIKPPTPTTTVQYFTMTL